MNPACSTLEPRGSTDCSAGPDSKTRSPKRRPAQRTRVLVALSWWDDRILAGIARYATKRNWVLDCSMRLTSRPPPEPRWRGDGVIACTGAAHPIVPLIDYLKMTRVPVVTTHAEHNLLGAPAVIVPHAAIGCAAAEHLLERGFGHFGFVQFESNLPEELRQEGFAARLAAAGHSCHRLHIGDFSRQVRDLPRPTGLMAANDVHAVAVIAACLRAQAAVPQEFAVVGVDDSEPICDVSAAPLSSVACDYLGQGYAAAALLDRLLRGEPAPAEPLAIAPKGVAVRRSPSTLVREDAVTTRALHFLRERFREPIRIKELAGELGPGFRRAQLRFPRRVGHTMAAELARLRLEHAKKLLADRNRKIEAISLESGFASRFHFTQAFHRATGLSPKEYRAQLWRGIDLPARGAA